jgi:hypothetical protein
MILTIEFILFAVTTFARSLVLKKLWAWFIVQYFGIIPLNIGIALGIVLLYEGLQTPRHLSIKAIDEYSAAPDTEKLYQAFVNTFAQLAHVTIVFVFVWAIHKMM